MNIQIKNRFTGKILFECEAESIKIAVEKAVEARANLAGANLAGAYLDDIKKDFFERLTKLKDEAIGLYQALREGRVDGSCYEGECACFIGTAANVARLPLDEFERKAGLERDASSPTERWFLAIRPGHADGHPVVDITVDWMREWAKENGVKLPEKKVVWE